jgi:hypothetical protein
MRIEDLLVEMTNVRAKDYSGIKGLGGADTVDKEASEKHGAVEMRGDLG